jgi:hypothetical protein
VSAGIHRHPEEHPCDLVDRLPKDLRELVHEYGLSIVVTFYNNGIRNPATIRHLVRTARQGAREPGNRRGYKSRLAHLDAWLVAQGAGFTARQVVRVIREGNMTVLPMQGPTREMVCASIAAVTPGMGRIGTEDKHNCRLTAAMTAGDRALWGDF